MTFFSTFQLWVCMKSQERREEKVGKLPQLLCLGFVLTLASLRTGQQTRGK